MKIATLNINSVNARLPLLLSWLFQNNPDVLLLQEIKAEYNAFPFFELNAAGYQVKISGQKAYNGVAVLSKHNITLCRESLPGFDYPEARYIETKINDVLIASIYMPNGNPVGSPNYQKKLDFMDAFYRHAKNLKLQNDKIIFGGDFNVILSPHDVYNPSLFANDALFQKEVQNKLTAIQYLGYFDAYRTLHPNDFGYTYWDYGQTAFANDFGLRIDYLLCSPVMVQNLKTCVVDRALRGQEKPSDHTALIADFNL